MRLKQRNGCHLGLAILVPFSLCVLASNGATASEQTTQSAATIQHTFTLWHDGDVVTGADVPMYETWNWFVHAIRGGPLWGVKLTATNPEPGIVWDDPQPTEGPANTFVWGGDVYVPENGHYGAGGYLDPVPIMSPGLAARRHVAPTRLTDPATEQVVTFEVVFTALPPDTGVVVRIGDLHFDDLVYVEVTGQNEIAPWWTKTDNPETAEWLAGTDELTTGVSYEFTATLMSEKSPLIVGDPTYKPAAHVGIFSSHDVAGPITARSVTVTHRDGVEVTFETSNLVEWSKDAREGKQVMLEPAFSRLEPCPEGPLCVASRQVAIDIKPGSFPNSINVKGKRNGVIPVAVLSTSDFDATQVDAATVEFAGAAPSHSQEDPLGHLEDVDGDGDLDAVFHFEAKDTNIGCGDTNATLTGELLGGEAIEGTDSVRTVGCK